jgi:hypothetical protein
MKTWTEAAEMRLESYLRERVAREGMHGEEASELKEDLRRHIHEEITKDQVGTCGLMELENALGRLDAGYQPQIPTPDVYKAPKRSKGVRVFLWFFAVIFPLGIVIFEWISNFCGSTFFEPIPTVGHGFLLLAAPLCNWWLLKTEDKQTKHHFKCRALASGVSFSVGLFYALLFLPLIPASCFALLAFGLGLLSLAPIIAWALSWRIAVKEKRLATSYGFGKLKRFWWATTALVFGGLCLFEAPAIWTRHQVARGLDSDPEVSQSAVESLRSWHSKDTLLSMCYETSMFMSGGDISSWITDRSWGAMTLSNSWQQASNIANVRDLYFKVTGEPFNTTPPPHWTRGGMLGQTRESRMIDEEFDFDHGGDVVAAKIKYLDCKESRFDAHLDTAARIGYGEWTLVFHNGATTAREARCQMRLPRGGQVSRLTLWINGEPCEAAFGSVAQVKAAYKEVAVVQRRDPVLVNMVGPDTIMVQCFPVPAKGDMKIRIGVTAPLEGDTWRLPYIIEKNFGDTPSMQHALWMQADAPFSCGDEPKPSHADEAMQSLSFSSDTMKMSVKLSASPKTAEAVWCEDRFAAAGEKILIAEPHSSARAAMEKIIVVVDGSKTLEKHREWISKALRDKNATILLANDRATTVTVDELAKAKFLGGCDNEPALYEALLKAKESPRSAVLWLHGPQPVTMGRSERLLQLLERGGNRPAFYALPLVDGANRLFESLGRSGLMSPAPSDADSETGLSSWVDLLQKGEETFSWQWSRRADATGLASKKVSDQLARFWAMEEVGRTKDSKLAVNYQIVSYVSGAVVLETMEQYQRHGLTPVDTATTPGIANVPETSTALMLLFGTLMACLRRKR